MMQYGIEDLNMQASQRALNFGKSYQIMVGAYL